MDSALIFKASEAFICSFTSQLKATPTVMITAAMNIVNSVAEPLLFLIKLIIHRLREGIHMGPKDQLVLLPFISIGNDDRRG